MTYTFKLSRRIARLRAPVFSALVVTFLGCNSTDSLDPGSTEVQGTEAAGQLTGPEFASVSFAGGTPFGLSKLPNEDFGSLYNGTVRIIGPYDLLSDLAAIKSRGGRIIVNFAGGQSTFVDADGHFSLTKWKARIDRFRTINFSSYVSDGTVIAHYLIDEPQDKTNWNGTTVSPATLDEMAKYSKQLWPGMATVVRVEPRYFTSSPQYVDAAWAQYLARFGDVNDYLSRNVSEAKARGLGLVVGLNVLDGGVPSGSKMTASQVESFGSAMLSSSYPCAFVSWQYDANFLSSSGMSSAMATLRSLAQNRSLRSCGSSSAPAAEPAVTPPPSTALPFGLSYTPAAEYSTRYNGTVYRADPSEIEARLSRAEASGIKVIAALAASAQVKNADGTFNLTKWKSQVDRFRNLSLAGYITRKTLYLHYLVDLPACASCWGGHAIPWSTLEEMARYSKSIWPALPTVARVAPSALANATFRWTYLDAGWAQYNTLQGNLKTYLASQVDRAKSEGLGLVVGLNLLDASGVNTAPMTASQIKEFGTILAKEPSVCAVIGWRHDDTYLGQSGISAALDSVETVARSRDAGSCVAN